MDGSPRILVTGVGGFVGGLMTARLRAALPGAEVLAGGAAGSPALDVTRSGEVDALVARFRPNVVVHLAGMASPVRARAEPLASWDVNLFGTMHLAEAVVRHAPEARFVQARSPKVYGESFNAAGGTVDESVPLALVNPYATTKASVDLLLGELAESGLGAVRLPPFNQTGPGQATASAVPTFAAQIFAIGRNERELVLRVSNLDARRDFPDVGDVVEAYFVPPVPGLPRGVVLNVASGEPRRICDVLDALLVMSRTALRVERDPALMRPSDVSVTAGDAARARAVLG